MHEQAYSWLKSIRHKYTFTAPVLEVGSIDINGSARELWGDLSPYVGVDIVPGKNVDVVCDIRSADVLNNRRNHPLLKHDFSTIICTEVLEHVEPAGLIGAFFPYMAEHCMVVITAASINRRPHSADGSPEVKENEYYKNVKPTYLYTLLKEVPMYIDCLDCNVILTEDKTDVYAVAFYQRNIAY
jgi:hypothetical protein